MPASYGAPQTMMPVHLPGGSDPSTGLSRTGLFPAHLYPLHPQAQGGSGRLHRLGPVHSPGEGRVDLGLACVCSRKPRQKSTAGQERNNFGQGCGSVLAQVPRLGQKAVSPAVIPQLYAWPQKCLHGRRLRNFFTRRRKPWARVQRAGGLKTPPGTTSSCGGAGLSWGVLHTPGCPRAVDKTVLLPGFEMQATRGVFSSFSSPSTISERCAFSFYECTVPLVFAEHCKGTSESKLLRCSVA